MAQSLAPASSAVLRDCCDEFPFYENEPTRTRTPVCQHAGNVQMGGAAGPRRKLDRDRHKRVPAIAAGEYDLAEREWSSGKSYHCECAVHQVQHCEGEGCVRDSDAVHTVLDQLNKVSYNYKTGKDKAHVGFIEDDISDGWLTFADETDAPINIKWNIVVALMVLEVQELRADIENLKRKAGV